VKLKIKKNILENEKEIFRFIVWGLVLLHIDGSREFRERVAFVVG
jgi:hypothetical protein